MKLNYILVSGLFVVAALFYICFPDTFNRSDSAAGEAPSSTGRSGARSSKSDTLDRTARSPKSSHRAPTNDKENQLTDADLSLPPLPLLNLAPPTAQAQALLASLVDAEQANRLSTQDGLFAWGRDYTKLVDLGDDGVAAIRAYLQGNTNLDFGPVGEEQLGWPNSRLAMLSALSDIGSAAATSVMVETLRGTTTPLEIALLAQNLHALAPEQFQRDAIVAASRALNQAARGATENVNVAPLFHVLQSFGDESVVPLLRRTMGQWKYYASAALADMPNGAGVETLIHMASTPEASSAGDRIAILQSLARVSLDHPEIRSFFIERAGDGQLPSQVWPYVAKGLSGDRLQFTDSLYQDFLSRSQLQDIQFTDIVFGNQRFYTIPGTVDYSPEKLQDQIEFVEQLLEVLPGSGAEPFL
jgi:hypothetical protein